MPPAYSWVRFRRIHSGFAISLERQPRNENTSKELFHVEQSGSIFRMILLRCWKLDDGEYLKASRKCRHADISFFFPTKIYLCSDCGTKIGSRHSHNFDFRAS